jgi:hypothetical protein
MSDNENNVSKLPAMAMEDIPAARADAKRIVALVREKGHVSGYKLSDGNIVSKEDGVRLAKDGGIRGVGVAKRKGSEYLKSVPDGSENNNLGSLPSVTQ